MYQCKEFYNNANIEIYWYPFFLLKIIQSQGKGQFV